MLILIPQTSNSADWVHLPKICSFVRVAANRILCLWAASQVYSLATLTPSIKSSISLVPLHVAISNRFPCSCIDLFRYFCSLLASLSHRSSPIATQAIAYEDCRSPFHRVKPQAHLDCGHFSGCSALHLNPRWLWTFCHRAASGFARVLLTRVAGSPIAEFFVLRVQSY